MSIDPILPATYTINWMLKKIDPNEIMNEIINRYENVEKFMIPV